MERVWRGDRGIGVSLPWERLMGAQVRAVIVQNPAPQVWLGRSGLSPRNVLRAHLAVFASAIWLALPP